MLYPKAAEWKAWGIDDECHQFFCLHWTELSDPETPDTWQVRSCNVKTILRELIDASRMADGFDAYRGVLRSILDEAFEIVKRDAILERYYPFVSDYLEPWRNKDIGENAVPQIERLAVVILAEQQSMPLRPPAARRRANKDAERELDRIGHVHLSPWPFGLPSTVCPILPDGQVGVRGQGGGHR